MEIKNYKKQYFPPCLRKGIIWVLVIFSLIFLTEIAQSQEKFKPRFSIKLTGGAGYIFWGDVNKTLNSLNELLYPKAIGGEIDELNNFTPDWEAELRIDISPKFAIGLSTSGSIYVENENFLEYETKVTYAEEHTLTGLIYERVEVNASMPIKLGIYYNIFYSPKINILLNCGIGYYSASVSEKREVSNIFRPPIPGEITPWTRYWEANSKWSVGFHGGIGFEYNIADYLAIVSECQARYVKISNLKGYTNGKKGTLFLCNYMYSPIIPWAGHLDLVIFERKPDATFDMTEIRKGVVDLSGFSLRVGIRIKLF